MRDELRDMILTARRREAGTPEAGLSYASDPATLLARQAIRRARIAAAIHVYESAQRAAQDADLGRATPDGDVVFVSTGSTGEAAR